MVDKCYICKRGRREINSLFKEILTPFREKVAELEKKQKEITENGKEKMEAFKAKHEGKDYLNFNFHTIKTDKEQFEKVIPDLSEFFQYQNWRTYKKFNNKAILRDVVDYVNAPDFWDVSIKKKYVNDDPRIELQSIIRKKEEWNRLISNFDLNKYSARLFSKRDFDFLDKDERKPVVDEFAKRTSEVHICPVCKDILQKTGKGKLKLK